MKRTEIIDWLRQTDERRLEELWRRADETRRQHVGDQVHLRGLVEFSNRCSRNCGYCGLRAGNPAPKRYRMTAEEILDAARRAERLGYGTVVLQSGEDWSMPADWLADVVRRIKADTPLAVTLSVGERDEAELILWRSAGADRYLLRFETSDPELYRRIHPPLPNRSSDRIALLRTLRRIGYEVGSGVMIGIPGQMYESLARDIELFAELELDMIGVGPYIPAPGTPLAEAPRGPADVQVSNTVMMAYKVVALARLMCPLANIPATTAVATLNRADGRELALKRGANIVMPNVTPPQYRTAYEIYPDKACLTETPEACGKCLGARIAAIGRTVGQGRGDSPQRLNRSRRKEVTL